jgi:hypothetical protein
MQGNIDKNKFVAGFVRDKQHSLSFSANAALEVICIHHHHYAAIKALGKRL